MAEGTFDRAPAVNVAYRALWTIPAASSNKNTAHVRGG
jgi:hypothetical protein